MMNALKATLVLLVLTAATGCAVTPVQETPTMSVRPYKDQTLQHPNVFFEETPQSRAVVAGSVLHANLSGCSFIQRYRLATNADFTATTNMFKYRAHMMGAERIVFLHHSELDASEGSSHLGGYDVVMRTGTASRNARYLSVMIGDLYDCPCTRDTCK